MSHGMLNYRNEPLIPNTVFVDNRITKLNFAFTCGIQNVTNLDCGECFKPKKDRTCLTLSSITGYQI